jgi:hypothetical protein
MPIKYKKKCIKCKEKYVIVTWKDNYPICYDCQKQELSKEITDPAMKKMFDIPEEFYKENSFLRNIKLNYLRYGRLTDPQIDAFKKTIARMKEKLS